MTKLTPDMEEVVALLKTDGWEIGHGRPWGNQPLRYWMQKGKLGHGGESRNVRAATFNGLVRRGIIRFSHSTVGNTVYTLV